MPDLNTEVTMCSIFCLGGEPQFVAPTWCGKFANVHSSSKRDIWCGQRLAKLESLFAVFTCAKHRVHTCSFVLVHKKIYAFASSVLCRPTASLFQHLLLLSSKTAIALFWASLFVRNQRKRERERERERNSFHFASHLKYLPKATWWGLSCGQPDERLRAELQLPLTFRPTKWGIIQDYCLSHVWELPNAVPRSLFFWIRFDQNHDFPQPLWSLSYCHGSQLSVLWLNCTCPSQTWCEGEMDWKDNPWLLGLSLINLKGAWPSRQPHASNTNPGRCWETMHVSDQCALKQKASQKVWWPTQGRPYMISSCTSICTTKWFVPCWEFHTIYKFVAKFMLVKVRGSGMNECDLKMHMYSAELFLPSFG